MRSAALTGVASRQQSSGREAEMSGIRTRNTMTVDAIAQHLGATVIGSASLTISGVNFIQRASEYDLAFVGDQKNLRRVKSTAAMVIIAPHAVAASLAEYSDKTFLLVNDAEPAFLQIAELLLPKTIIKQIGVSPQAVVSESAIIGARSNIHPFAVIGDNVQIGENCNIASGAVIGDGCILGDNVAVDANAVLYPNCVIDSDVQIQSTAVLGPEGFGYRTVNGVHERLPHVGIVHVESDVQIGAGTTIDRAKMGATVIGSGTRLDNQVMIAHNCQIGDHNLICSQTGVAGSSTTGSYVVLAGQVGVADHVTIGAQSIIGAKSGVHRDMPASGTFLGSPARKAEEVFLEMSALRRLPQIRKTVKQLEKQVAELQGQIQQLLAAQADAGTVAVKNAA
jgi:UDP-3-O-[3-hydroxymyristoyl] glucosamine N-acyltransferase